MGVGEDVDVIVGPDRRRQLIAAFADRLVLETSMPLGRAVAYGEQVWPDRAVLLAPGQVWELIGEVRQSDIGAIMQVPATLTIERADPGAMVDMGGGRHLHPDHLWTRYRLVDWPAHLPAIVEPQEPVGEPIPEPDEEEPDEEQFDPRGMFVAVHPAIDPDPKGPRPDHPPYMPMVGEHYRSRDGFLRGCTCCFLVTLDVIEYLRAGLANYRDGWADYRDGWRRQDALFAFNEMTFDGYDTDTAVAAYLGHWLWESIRGDVVREHGGTVDDYDTMFMWGGHLADVVIEAFAYADPRVELPVDHDLMQCPGQQTLFDPAALSA